ncbi:MAG: cobalamin adenosyltransferase [Firmicutes bacterium]|nr:cobalamin adenosyltransferase [Bacillota bacterium]
MKFITEEDLRDLYKTQPFTDYDLQEGERLTPGARQFLLDRSIDLYDRNDPFANITSNAGNESKVKPAKPLCEKKKAMYGAKFRVLETKFLLTAKELLTIDVMMSQQVTNLYKQFKTLVSVADGECVATDLTLTQCTGITEENFSCCIGGCFDITEFHMQMPKGKEMLMLLQLRSELEVFDIETEELVSDVKLQQCLSGKLNQIINRLSQMICSAMGGSECQRA